MFNFEECLEYLNEVLDNPPAPSPVINAKQLYIFSLAYVDKRLFCLLHFIKIICMSATRKKPIESLLVAEQYFWAIHSLSQKYNSTKYTVENLEKKVLTLPQTAIYEFRMGKFGITWKIEESKLIFFPF